MTPDELPADMEARTPAPEGEAWRTVPIEPTEAMLVNGREALMPLVRLDSYGPLIGIWKDMLAASPVVPVGSGESERRLVGQDYINAIKAHRVEHDSSLAVARNAVDCGWRPPAPVVPVGVSREEIARAVHRGRFPEDRKPTPFEAEDASGTTYCFRIADAIIAALRHTDTGRE
jgi:hypothetical protein